VKFSKSNANLIVVEMHPSSFGSAKKPFPDNILSDKVKLDLGC
jgi:hypothetical protein